MYLGFTPSIQLSGTANSIQTITSELATALELHQCSPSEAASVTDFVRYGHAECLAQRNYHRHIY